MPSQNSVVQDNGPIRWGIIGVGNVCEVKSGPGFQKADGSELVAVMRRDVKAAEDFATRHGVPHFYGSVDEILAHEGIDAWYIASPPGTHLEITLKCLEKTGKPCYVEKPVARNFTETLQLVEAFEARNVPLFTAYYRRGQEKFHWARSVIKEGRLGTIASVSYTFSRPSPTKEGDDCSAWRYKAEHSGGGLIMDVGCHTLDILDFLLGPISETVAHATNLESAYNVEDIVAMSFKISVPNQARRALGSATWCFSGFENNDEIVIQGSEGVLRLSTFGKEPVRLHSKEGVTEKVFEAPKHVQQPLIQYVVNDLRGTGPKAPSAGANALRVARVLDDCLTGYYSGRADQFWQWPRRWAGKPSVAEDTKLIVSRATALVQQLYQSAGVDDSHGTKHVLQVLHNLDMALLHAPNPASISESRRLACRLAALLHDADDSKYFPATAATYANAVDIATHAGASPDVVQDMKRMISYVSCSHNGNSVPPEARDSPELLWPRWADRLEAVGKIGVARCYMYNKHKGDPLSAPTSPRPTTEEEIFELATPERFEQYQKSHGSSASMIDHYYDKLFSVARPPAAIVQNPYLEKAAANSAAPLVDIALEFARTGKVPVEKLDTIVKECGLEPV